MNTINYNPTRVAFEQTNCGVCRTDYTEGEKIVELACKHIFHEECISSLNRCSLCRRRINPTNLKRILNEIGTCIGSTVLYINAFALASVFGMVLCIIGDKIQEEMGLQRREFDDNEGLDWG